MKRLILALPITLLLLVATSAEAQIYTTAVGARLGYPLSASIKHFVNESVALEGYVGLRNWRTYRWANISGAYLVHKPFPDVDNLQYYFGGGGSIYFWNYKEDFIGDNDASISFGLQAYLGLDYTFDDVPISITLDWIPTLFLNGFGSGFGGRYGSLGVRYILPGS
ncbi:MAG: hypothetical protein AAF990_15970 [Bacteroidota bacterium]